MKKYGLRLAIIGFAIGIGVGLGILALKNFAARQLVGLLQDEVQLSTGCSFSIDRIDVSLLRLRVDGYGPRMVCKDGIPLSFEKLDGTFSLSAWRDHIVYLDRLRLFHGRADGVGPHSKTYKFVDSLLAPAPPERDYPGRWKLKLRDLEIHDSSASQRIGSLELEAKGVSVIVKRTPENNFSLVPHIKTVELNFTGQTGNAVSFGNLGAELYITDDYIDFRPIKLTLDRSYLSAEARVEVPGSERLTGEAGFLLSKDLPLGGHYLPSEIEGSADISGILESPQFDGKFEAATTPFLLNYQNVNLGEFDSLEGGFRISSENGPFKFTVPTFLMLGAEREISTSDPVVITEELLSGTFRFALDRIEVGGLKLEGLSGTLKLSGSPAAPSYRLELSAAKIQHSDISLTSLKAELNGDSDSLRFQIFHPHDGSGSLETKGRLLFRDGDVIVEDGTLAAKDLSAGWLGGSGSDEGKKIAIDAEGSVSGPLDGKRIASELTFKVKPHFGEHPTQLEGGMNIHGGALSLSFADQEEVFTGALTGRLSDSEPWQLKLELLKEQLASRIGVPCAAIKGVLKYSFQPHEWRNGSGALTINRLGLGCAPYKLGITDEKVISIQKGKLHFNQLKLSGRKSDLVLNGTIGLESGLDLTMQGAFEIDALAPLLPKIDDLHGRFVGAIALSGPLSSPSLNGNAALSDSGFHLESAGIDASGISAVASLSGQEVKIESLSGELNGGRITVSGSIFPLQLEQSKLLLNLKNSIFNPYPDLSLMVSSELTMTQNSAGVPFVEGLVTIDSAEFARNMDLRSVVRSISQFLLSRSRSVKQSGELPLIELNVGVSGSRNIFVFTNWLNAELRTDIKVRGTAEDPQLSGTAEVLSGWFGLKDRRFEITSGTIEFKPDLPQPLLDVVGEAYLYSRTGETVLVVVEAQGPVASPKIILSSDKAYSERELVALISGGSAFSGRRLQSPLDSQLDFAAHNDIFDEEEGFSLARILSHLTTLDSVTLEPSYNFQSGAVEPAIVARKRLLERLTLQGESFFGSSEAPARLEGVYALFNAFSAYGSLESRSIRENTALEAGAIVTILSGQREFLTIKFEGNEEFDALELQRAIRINSNSRIECKEAARLRDALERFYHSHGFFDASIRQHYELESYPCRRIDFLIEEGAQSTVASVRLIGDRLPEIKEISSVTAIDEGSVASQQLLISKERDLVMLLRNEGYISARVDSRYVRSDSAGKDLELNVRLGRPVTFVFKGNKEFSARELLESINLFNRKLPLGANTINILVENIERKYREAGYLYATISHSREESESGRAIYYIDINEEERVDVGEVDLRGLTLLKVEELRAILKERYPERYLEILKPKAALAELLESNVEAIAESYWNAGFPEARVSYNIVPDESGKKAVIVYNIKEGPRLLSEWVHVAGLPPGFHAQPPRGKYSIAEANTFIENTLRKLREEGYLKASISSTYDHSIRRLQVLFETGDRTLISRIVVDGNDRISENVIRDRLGLKSGDPWDLDRITAAKKRLLRLGLFSRIEIEPFDGALDSAAEEMHVRLEERALQTLEIGAGANSTYGLHLFSEATDKSLFTDGRSISLISDIYYKPQEDLITQGVAGIIYTDPNFIWDEYVLTEDLRYQKYDISTQEFDLDRGSLASYIYRNWSETAAFSFGHTFQREQLDNVSPGAILSPLDTGNLNLSFLSGTVSFDHRDAPLQPFEGYSFDMDYKLATEAIGSDANIGALGGRFSWIQPLEEKGRGFSLALATRLASSWAFGGTSDVPISQRYYLGGRSSIRGFRENSLGPRGPDDSVIGGDLLVANNFELRYMLSEYTEVHGFLDAGTVYLKERSVAVDDMRYSTGIGFRLISPLGPIGVDLGHPINEKSGEPSLRLHFSIGSNF
ncbi:MAG: translocation/assembly module TamB domain-containing protein [Deltaproteobacteria bacterium]|nr:translocation/assembly module TamB domain-containing protein [Deltaproteobacteria bacterium]